MLKLNAESIRIPKEAREAVLRHETVIISSHEHPILALVNVDDIQGKGGLDQVGKPFGAIVNELANIALPDLEYFEDLKNINCLQEQSPLNPWE